MEHTGSAAIKDCRCAPCEKTRARKRVAAANRRARLALEPEGTLAAGRARGHLRALLRAGLDLGEIAYRAELETQTLTEILDGVRTHLCPEMQQAIMGVSPRERAKAGP